MLKEDKFLPTFSNFGWKIEEKEFEKAKNILASFREKRSNKRIPIFSIIDSDDDLDAITKNSKFFKNDSNKMEEFILIGTGGSSLGAEALMSAIDDNNKLNYHILNNLDSSKINSLLKQIEFKNFKVLAISKSGNTTETISLLLIICNWLQAKGLPIENHIMIMSDLKTINRKNIILDLARSKKIKTIEHESDVSGRFSSLTSTGLLPAAILGADPYRIRGSSRKALDYILDESNFMKFGSSIFADKSIHAKKLNCVMNYGSFLNPFVKWYRQLWAESLGKNGKGLFFISAEGSVDQHSQLQMWLDGPNIGIFTFLVSDLVTKSPSIPYFKSAPWLSRYALSELLKIMAMSTYDSLKLKNRPVRMINIPNRSVESVASLMTIYLVEVLLVAELLNVNPYDQPAVEDIKVNTLSRLKK